MTALPCVVIFLAGCLFVLGAQACYAMWRNPQPPEGHHVVKRKGKRFVRRNPKPKQQQLPLSAAGEQ